MIKKIAIFVEGYTEVQFLDKLIQEICGKNNVIIDAKKIRGGGKSSGIPKTISSINNINATKITNNEKYYFLIFDCGGDKSIASEILSQHESLHKNGYIKIIGIRDVRPEFTFGEIPRLEVNLRKYIKTNLIPVHYVLSVMEVEAWFLAETNHFANIDNSLNLELIKNKLGFNPEIDDLSLRETPMIDLDNCYKLVGKEYSKSNSTTVDAIDYENLYLNTRQKFVHLNNLMNCIDEFVD